MRRITPFVLALMLCSAAAFGGLFSKPTPAEVTRRAEQGNAKAQFTLGEMYANGDGVIADSAEAVRWYRLAADQQYTRAEAALGYMYMVGRGVRKDPAEALRLLRSAADKNSASAQFNLGVMYATGDGVPKDSAEAARWYRLAADQETGHAKARYNLGVMYATGDGVRQDPDEAIRWYLKAAELNYAKAQCNLGYMYATGTGVKRDSAEAVKWYRRAADQGDATALFNLGVMAAVGDGVPQNLVQAHAYLKEAGAQGDKDVRPNLAAIEEKMTPEQKAEARELAAPKAAPVAYRRPNGWYARFRPAPGTRVDLAADGAAQPAAVEVAGRYGVWVAQSGPHAEVEFWATEDESVAPVTFSATVVQRAEEVIVIKLEPRTDAPDRTVHLLTLFPKAGTGFLVATSGQGPAAVDPRQAKASAAGGAGGVLLPLVRSE